MKCKTWEILLQTYLDEGDKSLLRHLDECPDCATERILVQRFLHGLELLHPPAPPSNLTERLTAGVLPMVRRPTVRLHRHRQLPPRLALALAASLLLALGVWLVWPRQVARQPIAFQNEPALPPQLSLRESWHEAQTAMRSLSSRAANETVDTTTSLLPTLPMSLDPMVPIEPPIKPLREATAGVEAFAPVTESARRAVGLFLRDLPFHRRTSDKKPG